MFNRHRNAEQMAARRGTRARGARLSARRADRAGDPERAAAYRKQADAYEAEMRQLLGYSGNDD